VRQNQHEIFLLHRLIRLDPKASENTADIS
jgi:hypothetical protein